MKILVLTPDLCRPGGVANYYRCIELDKEKEISYFSVNDESVDSKILWIKKIKRLVWLMKRYAVYLIHIGPYELIHINPSLGVKSFYRDMLFIILARVVHKKIIIFFRGWDDQFELKIKSSILLKFLFKNSYGKATTFIVLGQTFKRKLIDLGVDSESKFYFETTIADSRFLKTLNIQKKINDYYNTVEILYISRILSSKGVYIAIEAFEQCQHSVNRPMKLYIAGDGEELNAVKEYTASRGIQNVVFPGYVRDEQKGNLLLKCHILFFPTLYGEGMPNAVLEGMLYAMPIISRAVGGIPDVVNHEVNGYLSDSENPAIFSEYLTELVKNKENYELMAKRNYQIARETFVTEKVRSRLLSIYEAHNE